MMEHYIVEVDFGDNAVTAAKHIQGEADLASYLARVPNMMGFQINQIAQINISHVVPKGSQTPLPGLDRSERK
jgi:hypothetical protein